MRPGLFSNPLSWSRRRVLVLFINGTIALLGAAGAGLAAVFAVRSPSAAGRHRWIRAGNLSDLVPDMPVARIVSFSQTDGWHRTRSKVTVFLIREGADKVRAMSATCTHLGCQVNWDNTATCFRCPCHGGVFNRAGTPVEGPPPRPLDSFEVRIETDGIISVRL